MKPIPSVLTAPWLVEPQWLRVVFGVWSRGQIDAAALAQAKTEWEARKAAGPKLEEPGAPVDGTGGTLRLVGDVGVITIEGPLFRHASLFCDISGGTSYDAIWRGVEAALANERVAAILLRVNSPGGEADGCNELAKGIAEAAARKLTWAFAEGMCCSAAYWLGSQADHIVAEECAQIGSIGARLALLDDSARDAMHGLREIHIVSSQSPGKRPAPIDDEVIGRHQVRLDDLAAIFIRAVAEGRGVDEETVLSEYGQGDYMLAARALAAGMVDEIGNLSTALAALSAASKNTSPEARAAARLERKGTAMTMPKTADADNEWKCASCGEMMGPSADKHCSKCAAGPSDEDDEEPDGDEESKALVALGLLGKTRGDTRKKLFAFAQSVVEATSAKTAGSAIVVVLANAKAGAELATFRAESEKSALAARNKGVGEKLAAAIATGKIQLGTVAKEVPLLSGAAKASIRTALAAIGEKGGQDKAAIVAAITSAPVSEEFAASVDEWIESKGASALPAPRREAGAADAKALSETAPPAIGADGLPKGADLSIDAIQKAAAEQAAAKKGA